MKQSIGQLVKAARKMRGFSQRELSERSNVSQTAISGVELGTNTTLFMLLKLIDALGYELHFSLKLKKKK